MGTPPHPAVPASARNRFRRMLRVRARRGVRGPGRYRLRARPRSRRGGAGRSWVRRHRRLDGRRRVRRHGATEALLDRRAGIAAAYRHDRRAGDARTASNLAGPATPLTAVAVRFSAAEAPPAASDAGALEQVAGPVAPDGRSPAHAARPLPARPVEHMPGARPVLAASMPDRESWRTRRPGRPIPLPPPASRPRRSGRAHRARSRGAACRRTPRCRGHERRGAGLVPTTAKTEPDGMARSVKPPPAPKRV